MKDLGHVPIGEFPSFDIFFFFMPDTTLKQVLNSPTSLGSFTVTLLGSWMTYNSLIFT